jgi:hypothetical protein
LIDSGAIAYIENLRKTQDQSSEILSLREHPKCSAFSVHPISDPKKFSMGQR